MNNFHDSPMYFGIISGYSEEALTSDGTIMAHHEPNYMVSNLGQRMVDGARHLYPIGVNLEKGAEISLTLNLKRAEFLFRERDETDIILFKNIERRKDIEYIFFLQMQNEFDSVTLLDFITS